MSVIKCCKDCKERYLGCHDRCAKYIEEVNSHIERKRKINEEKIKDKKADAIMFNRIDRMNKMKKGQINGQK